MVEGGIDHVRLHHHPTIGNGAGDHRHVQRNHGGVALPEATDRQQRELIGEVGDLAEEACRRRRQIDRHFLADSPLLRSVDHQLRAELGGQLGERDVAAAVEDLDHRAAARLAAVVGDRVGCLRRQPRLVTGKTRSSVVAPFSKAMEVVMTLKLDPGMYRSW